MSSTLVNDLATIVEKLIELNEKLLEYSRHKQDAIFEEDMEKLEEYTRRQADVSGQVEELNERRRKLSEELLSDEETPITLETVVDRIDGEHADDLSDKRLRLKDTLRDVQRFTRENMRLLENRMSIFESLFERIEDEQSDETYAKDRTKADSGTGEAMIFDEAI